MARGYRSYKGGPRLGSLFNLLLLLAIVVAAVVIFVLAMQDYFVFTEEGIRFENPFEQSAETPSVEPSPSGTPQLIITTPTPTPTPTPSPTPSTASKATLGLKAIYLPDITDTLAVSGAIQLTEKGIINSVVVDMKRDDGTLSYISQTDYATTVSANPEEDPTDAIIRLKDAGLYMVASISAFKDNLVPRQIQSTSVKTQSGVIWLDRHYHGWLNPYNQDARGYVSELSLELSSLGFDEIHLRNFEFPTLGRPQLLHYGEDAQTPKTDVLTSYATELNSLLTLQGTLLSIEVSESGLNSPNTNTGQDGPALAAEVGRIYTDAVNIASLEDVTYTGPAFVTTITPSVTFSDPSASKSLKSALTTYSGANSSYLVRDLSGFYPSQGW